MGKQFKKIPVKSRERTRGGSKIRQHRKESNHDIMHTYWLNEGRVFLKLGMRTKHHETGNWAGVNGFAVDVECSDVAKAEEFIAKLPGKIAEFAKSLGLELPGAILVEGT